VEGPIAVHNSGAITGALIRRQVQLRERELQTARKSENKRENNTKFIASICLLWLSGWLPCAFVSHSGNVQRPVFIKVKG